MEKNISKLKNNENDNLNTMFKFIFMLKDNLHN